MVNYYPNSAPSKTKIIVYHLNRGRTIYFIILLYFNICAYYFVLFYNSNSQRLVIKFFSSMIFWDKFSSPLNPICSTNQQHKKPKNF